MNSSQSTQTFGRLRNFLWPIHGYEHRKLLPMLALFFLISFIYNILRCIKITIVVSASGAEAIPFLKVWGVLPAAVLITYLYTKLSNRFSREYVFYTMLGLFLGFFTLFLLVLHPNEKALELTTLSDFLLAHLPERLSGLKGLISIIRHWPLSLFYVLAEMWGAIVLSMLFWGFANEVTTIDEAKRFYAIFALGANFSGIFSGQTAQFLTVHEYNPAIPFGQAAWEQTLGLQLSCVLIIGMIIVLLYRWVSHLSQAYNARIHLRSQTELSPSKLSDHTESGTEKKLSLLECFAYLAKSPYMVYIAILVVAYNIVYNLSDVLWTHQVSQRYPDANEFNAYMNNIASITGIFATLSGFILSGNVIRRYGWTATAIITPLIWLVTSMGLYFCIFFGKNPTISDALFAFFSMPVNTLNTLILLFGSAQICLGRAAKYTVFDETKEIVFIPLPQSEQRKGKAVIDGIASRFGKSGGSLIIQVLLIFCHTLSATPPYIAGILLICITLWFIAVKRLGRLVTKSIDVTSTSSSVESASEGSPSKAQSGSGIISPTFSQ